MAEVDWNLVERDELRPMVRVLCYGNNDFKCSELHFDLSEERDRSLPFRISLLHAPDLDLFDRFTAPVYTEEVAQLIGQGERVAMRIDVFLILISLNTVFSQSMFDLLTSIPNILELKENKQYFWERAVIAFNAVGHSNPEDKIKKSIDGNVGIKQMLEMAGGRYTYLSTNEPNAFVDRLVEHCHYLTTKTTVKRVEARKPFYVSIKSILSSVLSTIWRNRYGIYWGFTFSVLVRIFRS